MDIDKADGKVIVVFGATGDVGRACVKELNRAGYSVIAVGRSAERLHEAFADSPDAHGIAVSQFTELPQIHRALENLQSELGSIRGIISTVGSYVSTPLVDLNLDALKVVLEDNLIVPMSITALAGELLRPTGGRLVHIGSVTQNFSRGGYSGYEAAKAGLAAVVRSAAVEFASNSIAVNAVAPGWINTRMAATYLESVHPDEIASVIPAARASEPEEIANVAVWLACEAPTTLTGQTIVIDGAQTSKVTHLG